MLQHVNGSEETPRRKATYEDVLAVPDHLVAEVIDGVLYTFSRPASRHARAYTRLTTLLTLSFDMGRSGPGGWWILAEPELHLDEDILVPDIAAWRRERMPDPPDVKFFAIAPDWICEVLSPSTEKIDREKKLRIYAREGVKHAWFVDPIAKFVEIYALDKDRLVMQMVYNGDDQIRAVPFDAIELALSEVWGETPVYSEQPPPGH